MRNLTLRARLVAGIAVVAVALVAVAAVVTTVIRTQLIDQVDARIRSAASFGPGPAGPLDGVVEPRPQPPQGEPSQDRQPRPLDERVSDLYQGVLTADGELITLFRPNLGGETLPPPDLDVDDLAATLGAGLAPDTVSDTVSVTGGPSPTGTATHDPLATARFLTVESTTGDITYRVLVERIGDIVTVTATQIDDVMATITQLVWLQVIGVLVILAALGLVGWWVMHLGIRPVKEMTGVATRIAAGEVGDRVVVTTPATEAGRLGGALNQMLDRIEEALDERTRSQQRLQQFVADASHELRTPVTTIRGYAELYGSGGLTDDATLDDAMRRTGQEAARIGRLVDDMLTLARLDEQRPLETRPVDLATLLRDAALDARAAAPTRRIDVVIDEDLDAHRAAARRAGTGSSTTTLGDEDRLRQVVANVVTNALIHAGADAAIRLRLRAEGSMLVIEVTDSGVGMTPDVAARATERFFRADPSRSRRRGGSGLGLAIVDATVAAHGGDVSITSAPGAGTTVRITLPARDGCTAHCRTTA